MGSIHFGEFKAPLLHPQVSSLKHFPHGPDLVSKMAELRAAKPADQRATYLWTVADTIEPGRQRPRDLGRQGLADVMLELYGLFGKPIKHWSSFLEQHQSGEAHLHFAVATSAPCRWSDVASSLRARGIFANCQTASTKASYWCMFAYCYAPSGNKNLSNLDKEPLLSTGPGPGTHANTNVS